MNIKQLKDELNIDQKDIAEFFDMNYMSFANSTAKERYETALCRFYSVIKKRRQENIKTLDLEQANDEKAQT